MLKGLELGCFVQNDHQFGEFITIRNRESGNRFWHGQALMRNIQCKNTIEYSFNDTYFGRVGIVPLSLLFLLVVNAETQACPAQSVIPYVPAQHSPDSPAPAEIYDGDEPLAVPGKPQTKKTAFRTGSQPSVTNTNLVAPKSKNVKMGTITAVQAVAQSGATANASPNSAASPNASDATSDSSPDSNGAAAPASGSGSQGAQTAPDSQTTQPSNVLPPSQSMAPIQLPPAPGSGFYNMFDHSKPSKFWVSLSDNFIYQQHAHFRALYSGANSFLNSAENKDSFLNSLFLGYHFLPRTDAFACIERFDGSGLSAGFGMGGYPNLDIQRNPSLGGKFYFARLGGHTVIPLSKKMVPVDRSPVSLESELPEKRIDLYIGRFSAVDFVNFNSVGSDSHRQFLNFAVDVDGSYDFPADTRGYTNGLVAVYQQPGWAARYLLAMMPTVANGDNLQYHLNLAHSDTYEVERRFSVLEHPGAARLMSYVNHANMGDYETAINQFLAGYTSTPNITATERQGAVKYGFGFNCEQEIINDLSVFLRTGWNEGRHETFAYTEVDNTYAFGASLQGTRWHRPSDKFGLAFVSNGLSGPHREYLQLGGLGFELGDGYLNYGREKILEMYYTCHVGKGLYFGPDFQYAEDPGYNKDRGPVPIFFLRLHTDF